jgi:hypothetical protein
MIDKQKRDFAYRLFQCLVVSKRPLIVEELAELFAIQANGGTIPTFNPGWRPEDPEEICTIGLFHFGCCQRRWRKNCAVLALFRERIPDLGLHHIVQLLLDHGTDANYPDRAGLTPLYLASQKGHNRIVQLWC